MFVLQDKFRFDYPVDVNLGVDDKGKPKSERFFITIEPMESEQAEALEKETEALPAAEQSAARDNILRRTIVGWRDVVADSKKKTPVPFSAANLDAMLKRPWIKVALFRAYTFAMLNHSVEDRRLGN